MWLKLRGEPWVLQDRITNPEWDQSCHNVAVEINAMFFTKTVTTTKTEYLNSDESKLNLD